MLYVPRWIFALLAPGLMRFLGPSMKGHSMNLFRIILILACVVIPFMVNAGEQVSADSKRAASPSAAGALHPLQGIWEGVMVGQEKDGKITITVTGDSLHFHRDTNFWFETTMTLPAGTNPKQLHATIKSCPPSQASSIGQVVVAIFKIEDGKLTLVTGSGDGEAPKSFETTGDNGLNRYELRKGSPQKKITELPKSR